jgi:hypothetical protein
MVCVLTAGDGAGWRRMEKDKGWRRMEGMKKRVGGENGEEEWRGGWRRIVEGREGWRRIERDGKEDGEEEGGG